MKRIIEICPSFLTKGYTGYSPKAIKSLFGGQKVSCFLDFNFEEDESGESSMELSENEMIRRQSVENLSISGAQEKYPAVIDNGVIRIAKKGERSTHILKPAPLDRILLRKQIPANEHLTMQIASQVYGIETASNGLCFTADGQPVYITRRFDIVENGNKLIMEDFASLVGRTEAADGIEFKYEGAYEDIANSIKKYIPASRIALEKFFKLVVFNYLFGNGDAHLKNFSIIRRGNDVGLAPAYDLINTAIHIDSDDLGLKNGLSVNIEKSDVYDRTGYPCRIDFERFGLKIGLQSKRIDKILNDFTSFPSKVDELIANSFFYDDGVKRKYKCIIEQRRSRFVRESE